MKTFHRVHVIIFLLYSSRCSRQTDDLINRQRTNLTIDGPSTMNDGIGNSTLILEPVNETVSDAVIDDGLIKNITDVLENLLKNYDNNHRPGNQGEPAVIYCNIFIRSMGPFSELDMAYSMDTYFRQRWTDHRLRFDGYGQVDVLSLDMKMLDRIWKPDTYFHNGLNSYLHTITRPNKFLRINQEGDVSYSMRLTIKAKCPMQLHNFPMDIQSCPLMFGSYAYTIDQVVHEWDPNVTEVSFQKEILFTQFGIIDYPFRNTTRIERGRRYSLLQVNFNLQRHTGYFLIQIYLPCILLVVLSWVSFWINREATADRVGLGITTVLTLSTISLDSRNDLPKVHYATAMDWFVIMSFVFVISTLLEFAGVHYLTKVGSGESYEDQAPDTIHDDEDVAMEIKAINVISTDNHPRRRLGCDDVELADGQDDQDDGSNIRDLIDWLSTHGLGRCCKQFFNCIIADNDYREIRRRSHNKRSGVNSVSLIDRISRIMFPLTFGLLNVFYWLFYNSNSDVFSWESQHY